MYLVIIKVVSAIWNLTFRWSFELLKLVALNCARIAEQFIEFYLNEHEIDGGFYD